MTENDQTINPTIPPMPTTDHDAIVTLVSEMRQLRVEVKDVKTDIKEIRDNVANRVQVLEHDKLDKEEAQKLMDEAMNSAEKIHNDHESRLREDRMFIDNMKGKYAVIAVVASIFISIIVSLTVFGLQRLLIKGA